MSAGRRAPLAFDASGWAALGWRIATVAGAAPGRMAAAGLADEPANIARQAAIDCGRSAARTASPASMAARAPSAIGEVTCDNGV